MDSTSETDVSAVASLNEDAAIGRPSRSVEAQRQRVEKEIYKLIAPYKDEPDKPPFAASELIVMACLCHPYPLSKADIVRWMTTNFSSLLNQAVTYYAEAQGEQLARDYQDVEGPVEVVDNLTKAYDRWDAPIVAEDGGKALWDCNVKISAPPGAGRIFLGGWLVPDFKARSTFSTCLPRFATPSMKWCSRCRQSW